MNNGEPPLPGGMDGGPRMGILPEISNDTAAKAGGNATKGTLHYTVQSCTSMLGLKIQIKNLMVFI